LNPFPLSRLEKVKTRGTKLIARCPACALDGADKTGEHLVIFDEGRGKWGCAAYPGDADHRRRIASLVGLETGDRVLRPLVLRRPPPPPPAPPRTLTLPALRFPTVGELATLAELRRLPFFAGLELAAQAGHLRSVEMRDAGETVVAWVLIDASRRNAQARRLDGKPWQGIGAKAKTLPGSEAGWPIGSAYFGAKPFVMLCEGGPDTLAAWSLAWWHGRHHEVAPCCMAGAGQRIHADALPLFRGKKVILVPHRDDAGRRAQTVWAQQLREAGALWVRVFDVSPHKDLNDLVSAEGAEIDADAC
jgi:hypothetical protein